MLSILLFSLIQTIPVDKAAHFGVSASINLACVQTMKHAIDSKAASIVLCSAGTLLIGAGKELSDPKFDRQDLLADALGVSFSAVFLSF